jgi:putative endonuclease
MYPGHACGFNRWSESAQSDIPAPRASVHHPGVDTHRLGVRFEDAAARWLEARGWRVLERNVRFKRREIDLIVRRGSVVAFVEVKGRRSERYGQPVEAVTWRKRREIEAVARWWIARHDDPCLQYRFDVIGAAEDGRGLIALAHFEDAWRPSSGR